MDKYGHIFMRGEALACKSEGVGGEPHIQYLLDAIPVLSRVVLGGEDVKITSSRSDQCIECGHFNSKLQDTESQCFVCCECGLVEHFVDNSAETNAVYGEELNPVPFTYKRENHFHDWLMKSAGQETTVVPHDIIAAIKSVRIKHGSDGPPGKKEIRKILREIGAAKYSENVQQIINTISGEPCKQFTGDQILVLKSMFANMQVPFDNAKNKIAPHRKNFLSYEYVIYKCCELREYDEMLSHFKLLKSKAKLGAQDSLWRHICEECRWQFIPST